MSLCINPQCHNPQNHDNHIFCQSCGSELLLHGLYQVRRQLGGGGFGRTYEAAEGDTLKVLKILTLNHPDALRLFKQEAEVLKKLNHPGIPKVEQDGYFEYYPKGSPSPIHYFVMEKIDGENLETYLEKRGQPIHQKLALKWLIKITEILHQVHQQGFLHRDLKPANIMLRPNGQLVLIDFGTVKEITATMMSSQAKKQGTGVYTPGYAPPEQEKGFTVNKSDFFALGRTFVHLLTNQPPLAFYNPETDDLDWRGAAPNLSPFLGDFLDELMQRLAKDRPKDTGVILQRLREIEEKLYPPITIPSPPPTISEPSKSAPISSFQSQTHQRRKLLPLSIAGGLVGIALIIGIGITQQDNQFSQSNSELPKNPSVSPVASPSPKSSDPLIKTLTGHSDLVISVAISPDGQTLVSGSSDKTIKIWNLPTGKLLHTLPGHSGVVHSVAISPDGQTLVSGSSDKTIKIWDLATGKLQRTLPGHSGVVRSVAISPDGQTLVSGSWDKTIKIWDLATGKLLHTLNGHSGNVISVAISPDGQTLVSGSGDKTINIWDLTTGKLLRTLSRHSDRVIPVTISPDSETIVSGSGDKTIKIWLLER